MTDWRDVSSEKFDREWETIRRKVFGSNAKVIEWDDFHFADPEWRMVPIPGYFVGEIEPGHDRPGEFPPVEPYFADYCEPLFRTLRDFGVDEIMITTRYESGDRLPDGRYDGVRFLDWRAECERHVLVRPCREAMGAVFPRHPSDVIYNAFDRDGGWGLVCDDDTMLMSVLGGPAAFIEAFLRHAGGDENVRAWFTYFILDGGCPLGPEDPETHPDDPDRKILEHFYRMAGWEFPRKWNAFAEETLDWPWILGWTGEKSDA